MLIQAEVRLALVAGDDLQMLVGQNLVVPQQFGVATVEDRVQAFPGSRVILGPHQADHFAGAELDRGHASMSATSATTAIVVLPMPG